MAGEQWPTNSSIRSKNQPKSKWPVEGNGAKLRKLTQNNQTAEGDAKKAN